MKLEGKEVQAGELKNPDPETMYVVVTDQHGESKVIKVNADSIPEGKDGFRVTAVTGCFIKIAGKVMWVDPCPY